MNSPEAKWNRRGGKKEKKKKKKGRRGGVLYKGQRLRKDMRESENPYPIMWSNCCCLMFGDTLQSTCPEPKVIARAEAISF